MREALDVSVPDGCERSDDPVEGGDVLGGPVSIDA